MEARLFRAAICAALLVSFGANYRTQNFIVTAPTPHFAQQVAISAENYRRDLAVEWLGAELPPWSDPCPITVHVGPQLGAGGATSFAFIGGRPTSWTMTIQGSAERILDSVLPHEVTHTVFATHFGRPLPRWADEGACTTVEHESERQKQHSMLYEFLMQGRGIAFNDMFAMQDYPQDVMPLYAQGYSLARFLIAQGGKRRFIGYVGDGMRWNNWTKATQTHYGIQSLSELQITWLEWVRRGCPALPSKDMLLAAQGGAGIPAQYASLQEPVTEPAPRGTAATFATASNGPSAPIASVAAKTSWYARVRNEMQESGEQLGSRPSTAQSLHDTVGSVLSGGQVPASPTVLSRPQPPQQARQQVIEWTQPIRR